jgi:hypothetical protein
MGLKPAHGLRRSAQRLAMRGQSEGENDLRGPWQRARVVPVRAVARSTAAWWRLAGGKVLPASTGGVPGWRRARGGNRQRG